MDAELIRHKLEHELHDADWALVAPHFARGVLVLCGDELPLLDAAVALAQDDTAQVARWMASGAMRRAEDHDAQAFSDVEHTFRFVIVAPFVIAHAKETS